MKKTLIALSVALVLSLALVSCEEGLPEGLVNLMGTMGTNVLRDDETNVENIKNATTVQSASPDEKITVGDYEIKLDTSSNKLTINGVDLDVEGTVFDSINSFILPNGDVKDIAKALDENAGKNLNEELAKPVEEEEEDAVKGTVALLNAALEAAAITAGNTEAQGLLGSLMIEEKEEYTKGDAVVLQAITNVIFDCAGDLADTTELDATSFIQEKDKDLFALVNIIKKSGSDLIDVSAIVNGYNIGSK